MANAHFTVEDATLYLRRELDPGRAADVELHAAQCPDCAAQLLDEAVLDERLSALTRRDPGEVQNPGTLVRRVTLLALAASLLVVLGAALLYAGGSKPTLPPTASAPQPRAMSREQLEAVDRLTRCLTTHDPRACQEVPGTTPEPPARANRSSDPR